MTTLLAVVGPTASGKTELAVALAEQIRGEIISCDSAQVFRRLDIGTAKPTPEEQQRARHHLVDVIEPDVQWTAAAFADAADAAIADVRARGKVPIVCGGAGLWLRALVHGVFAAPTIEPTLRESIRTLLRERGAVEAHAKLAELDAEAAKRLHPNDTQRIGRALEIVMQTGRSITAWQDEHRFATSKHDLKALLLSHPRDVLRERIGRRARRMYADGLVDETKRLLDEGVSPHGPSLSIIGYREAVRVATGDLDVEGAVELTTNATRQYAKRQLNWFRGESGIAWIDGSVAVPRALEILAP
ncbi:MAG: tRNA (adenosine(37)-N6)-dimethylallyltransferase MiaA [Deltaproteobacteria bacterium]|nr:tRNA (adenosine(37)-N6)-dimethylallyltransferase MiaA [Deltaproteobacteria bacterium]